MDIRILRVMEGINLGAFGPPGAKPLMVQFAIGEHGPFTINTTQVELDNGTARQKMEELARSIENLTA